MCTPQALPLRSHHFRKVGKKPVLTLVWDPEDMEQEPVQQVRTQGWRRFPRAPLWPPTPPLPRTQAPGGGHQFTHIHS